MPLPTGRLDERVLCVFVELLDVGLATLGLGPEHEIGLRYALPRMQALLLVRILVPGVRHEFLDLRYVAQIDVVNFLEVAVDDRAARNEGTRPVVCLVGEVAVGKHGLAGEAASDRAPVFVKRGDRLEIRYIDL